MVRIVKDLSTSTTDNSKLCEQLDLVPSSTISSNGFDVTKKYQTRGLMTFEEAEAVACAVLPDVIEGYTVYADDDTGLTNPLCQVPDRLIDSIRITGNKAQAKGVWQIEAKYSSACSISDDQFGFTTTGGTVHITQSLGTIGYGNAAQTYGAIGIQDDGSVEGIDIVASDPQFTITKCFSPGSITPAMFAALSEITPTTNSNDNALGAFGVRNLLFIGADGQGSAYGNEVVNFHFLAQPDTITNLNLATPGGGGRANVAIPKQGHDTIWVQYKKTLDTGTNSEIKVAEAAYVEQTYRSVDFRTHLGIYGSPFNL